ncbi:MAG TPA: NAD(P)-binding domain-containing protein, partial [Candidatus Dormibacteraeota bacterium]|nr:NAD(P)-binding domain-containing protein [Candidatus Dormibacteraeota bacterium]
ITRMTDSVCELAIVGAGPGGLSAAVRAAQHKVPHVLLEAADKHANTVQKYTHHKHVMAEPSVLPLRSDVAFAAGRREQVLHTWEQALERACVNISYASEVIGISGRKGDFHLGLKSGGQIRARHVILALGVNGNPRRLEVPGDELPCVQYTLESAGAVRGEHVIVVGGGDAAIENAMALAGHNTVTVLTRSAGFPRAKEGNAARISRAIAAGQIQCVPEAQPTRAEQAPPGAAAPYLLHVAHADGVRAIPCHRVIARLGAVPARRLVEPAGVRFLLDAPDAVPELSPRYESTVPGLYIVGALAGAPLIKQALNQGYEVVEHLLGRTVQPADHDILADKFRALAPSASVDETLGRIRDTVRVLRDVKELALRELLLTSKILTPVRGQRVFARGAYSSNIFNVIQGEMQLEGDGPPMTLRAGQMFGENCLVSGRPHEYTAVAGRDCIVLETPLSAMRRLLRSEPSVRSYVDTVHTLRALGALLMPHASVQTVHTLSASVRLHRFKAGEALFEQGDAVARFYLVRSGSVALSRRNGEAESVVAYCAAGSTLDAAGCLAGDGIRSLSARATVATEALSIEQAEFTPVLAADPLLRAKLQADSAQQLAQHARMHAQPEAGHVFSYLMSHGLGEATSVLVIDEKLCVGCDQCEKACAATHDGVSRLDRKAGPSLHSLHLPTSCRHCEHPHCMRDCPPHAIHRLPNGEVFIADTCIGCGNCVENCPYGVIQLAAVEPKLNLLDRLRGRGKEEPAKTAVKCDMCTGLKGGPACVRACPTGAAIRIHAEEVLQLAKHRAAAVA